MRALPVVLVSLLIVSPYAHAEDCTKLSSQAEQIACLQHTVDELQQRLERLDRFAVGHEQVEALIAQRLKEVLTPRLHQ
jgi:hypothetical protein